MLKQMRVMSWTVMGLMPLILVGCGETIAPDKVAKEPAHEEKDGHDHAAEEGGHPTEGPHHGHLIELGEEEYHAELVHDEVLKSVIIFLLDKDAKGQATSTDKEVTLNLVVDGKPSQKKVPANPQGGEPEGESSRFITVDAGLIEALEAEETTGRLTVNIGGKEYSGKIAHKKHEEHKE